MKLISAGAAQTVTGSCHLLDINDQKILIDCGLFQGRRAVEALNYEEFPFLVNEIDAVLLTHGHLDHIGRLPLLVKKGYRGPIYAPYSTQKIAEVILLDSAKIQQEDFDRALRKARRAGREHELEEPLYGQKDVEKVFELFRDIKLETATDLGGQVSATFYPAGHILGSAFIELNSPAGRIICSGDLGNRESGVQADAALPRDCDVVLVETTYANRNHRPLAATLAEFQQVLIKSVEKNGNVMIPGFALERTQNILYHLNNLMRANKIPKMPIYLDSPMAIKMTKLYQECKNEFLPELAQALAQGEDPFQPETVTFTASAEESKKLNRIDQGAIIIAGSGMMTGGRIVHHLKHNLWREGASLVVVGYQGEGTLGRRLIDGAKQVRIHGDSIRVRADIYTIGGFSAHADQDDLLAWLKPTGKAKIYMVHGETRVMTDFERTLNDHGREAVMVARAKAYQLG